MVALLSSQLRNILQIVETKENKEAKTSVDTVDFALLEYTEKDREKDVDSYLDTAVQADKFGCGSRFVFISFLYLIAVMDC